MIARIRTALAAFVARHIIAEDPYSEAFAFDRLDGVGATRTGMPHPRKHDDLEDDGDDD